MDDFRMRIIYLSFCLTQDVNSQRKQALDERPAKIAEGTRLSEGANCPLKARLIWENGDFFVCVVLYYIWNCGYLIWFKYSWMFCKEI